MAIEWKLFYQRHSRILSLKLNISSRKNSDVGSLIVFVYLFFLDKTLEANATF